jgi:hypothetical protein
MTEALQHALASLHEELGLQARAENPGMIQVNDHELRVVELGSGKAALVGDLGSVRQIAEDRGESIDTLLMRSLTLHAARFAKLGTPEALTLDESQLVLWKKIDSERVSVQDFLHSAESMLNEVEFWKNWLSAA